MGDRFPLLKFTIFALVCLAFAVWLIGVIGNLSLFEDRISYTAEFEDVTGLIVNDAVKVSGVTVGKVTGVEVKDGGTAIVHFDISSDVPLTEDTLLSVRWRDVFGLRFLYVDPGTAAVATGGHEFPLAQTSAPADLGLLLQRMTPVMSALDPELQNKFLESVTAAIVGREQEIRGLISDGAALTQAVASRDQEIGRLLVNAGTILEAYANRQSDLRGLLTSFADVSETLADRNDVLARAVTELADAQAQLGDFVDDNDEELRLAFDALERITDVLATNHTNLEKILVTSGRGVVAYHRITRLGQWFDVRGVGFSSDGEYDQNAQYKNAYLPPERCGPNRTDADPCPDTAGTSGGTGGAAAFFPTAGGR